MTIKSDIQVLIDIDLYLCTYEIEIHIDHPESFDWTNQDRFSSFLRRLCKYEVWKNVA